jgi:FtsP/CotA-like multicopper oxidase with cupredoxin domain
LTPRRAFLLAALAAGAWLPAPALAQNEKVFALALSGGRLTGAARTLRVSKGDKVELRWTSDRPIALHLHGYDLEATVTPQSPRTMSFTANIAGRFPVSEHGHGSRHERALLYLEVHP